MSVMTVGDFDGVHRGHRQLLGAVCDLAAERNTTAEVLTFDRNCKSACLGVARSFLSLPEEREELLLSCGISRVHTVKFDTDFSSMTPDLFLKYLNETYGCTDLIGGKNFRFGCAAAGRLCDGTVSFGVTQHEISLLADGKSVSSSAIREALAAGEIETANRMLSRAYSVCGTVVHGRRIGSELGFPTLNITPPAEKAIPKNGVYVTETVIEGACYPSVTNVGTHPTVSDTDRCNVETNLLFHSADLYGATVSVRFLARLRDERKFSSLDALRDRLACDVLAAKEWFRVRGKIG